MKKRIPTGIVNYEMLIKDNYYTVDKTLMIQEFVDRGSAVTLITRPRRFGKTSNMSMMSTFFDITKKSEDVFKGTKISETKYVEEMNQYPVIFLSFANCKGDYASMKKLLFDTLRNEYAKYQLMFEEEKTTQDSAVQVRKYYQALCDENDLVTINTAIKVLSKYLFEKFNKRVMIFIDEYDTPFIEAHVNGFYSEIRGVLSALLHSALKDNDYLQYAMLTGIQRVAKENIFSDLNNLEVFTVKDKEYAEYFGFTSEETKTLLEYYSMTLNEEVKSMYDGYNMGGLDVYNPWSIINYAKRQELVPYWVNTSSNTMIKQAMKQSDNAFKDGYETLIKQGYLDTQVLMDTSFYEVKGTNSLWGLFVNAGYLTMDKVLSSMSGMARVRIPNHEVMREFQSLTAAHLQIGESDMDVMFYHFIDKNKKAFFHAYRNVIITLPSYHDLKDENSYHMMMLGMCSWLSNDYDVISNRENGKGRSDIILKAKKKDISSYIIEFRYCAPSVKYTKDEKQLENLANEAVKQIEHQKYDSALVGEVIYIGLAHCGKEVEMCWQERSS